MTIRPRAVISAEQIDQGQASFFAETRTHAPGPEGMLDRSGDVVVAAFRSESECGNVLGARACSILEAREPRNRRYVPFAGACTDRTTLGSVGMFDSLSLSKRFRN